MWDLDVLVYFQDAGPFVLTRDAAPDQLDEIADFEEGQAIREPVRSIAEHFRRAEDYRRLATFKRDVNST